MPENINAAYRVIKILNALKNQGGRATYLVLGSAFNITGEDLEIKREVSKR